MSLLQATFRGLGHALSLLPLLFWLWLGNVLIALPAGLVMTDSLRDSIGASLFHQSLREGFDMDWYDEMEHEAQGLAKAFEPSKVTGAGPFLDNLDGWMTGDLFELPAGLLALGGIYVLFWLLMLGGLLSRIADPAARPGLRGLLERGGEYFGRFLRLALLALPFYYLIYRGGVFLYGKIETATRDATAETTVFAWALGAVLVVVLALHLVRMVFDYARIALVTGAESGTLGAALAGAGFVLAHPLRTVGLYSLLGLLALVLLAGYALVAPGPGESTTTGILLVFLLGQLYWLARQTVRIGQLAAQLEFFRSFRRF